MINSIIVDTGSYIPTKIVPNSEFFNNEFYGEDGLRLSQPNEEIIRKFQEITGIESRRYVSDDLVASDIGFFAAKNAIESSGIDPETLDYIIVAHNFGDVRSDNRRSDFVPNLGARIKNKLGINNPKCIPKDLPFGCPGWLQGMIDADYFIRSGDAKRVLVIGTETLSRVCDPHDRDSMIYADGAGATILAPFESDSPVGILSHAVRSDTIKYSNLLWMGPSYNPNYPSNDLFLKMSGNVLYGYALDYVPGIIKEALDRAGLNLSDITKLCIHQANSKMDHGILANTCKIYGYTKGFLDKSLLPKKQTDATIGEIINKYGINDIPPDIMPMTISWLGNSSVATVPTLLDLLFKGKLNGHNLDKGNIAVIGAIGAGMAINGVVYKMPY